MPESGDRLDLAIEQAASLLNDQQQGGTLLVIADSIDQDPQAFNRIKQSQHVPPIQILSLLPPESTESDSIRDVARQLDATVCQLSVDDQDISQIVTFSEQRIPTGIAGESRRWQEAGYWFSPLLALMVALTFRRQAWSTAGETS